MVNCQHLEIKQLQTLEHTYSNSYITVLSYRTYTYSNSYITVPSYRTHTYSNSYITVPSYRTHTYSNSYIMEGTEDLDDQVFLKRHHKHELDEKKRKRYVLLFITCFCCYWFFIQPAAKIVRFCLNNRL